MLNHSEGGRNVDWSYNKASESFIMKSRVPIMSHREITDSYGEKSNTSLLLDYGFVDQSESNKMYNLLDVVITLRATPLTQLTGRTFSLGYKQMPLTLNEMLEYITQGSVDISEKRGLYMLAKCLISKLDDYSSSFKEDLK